MSQLLICSTVFVIDDDVVLVNNSKDIWAVMLISLQGVKFLRRFKQLLNPAQVFDLMNGGPHPG